MSLDLQFKIKKNPNYIRFLMENSYWYKYLNRNDNYFKLFESEVKEKYKLRSTDKINKALDTITVLQTLFDTLKK